MKINEIIMTKGQILESDRSKLPEGVLCRVVYPICNIGKLNANNRVYEREVWEKVLNDEAIQRKLSNRTLFGQAEHPSETQSDLQLTSHTIFEMWIDENDGRVFQKMDVLDTPTGRIIDTLLRAGCQVGVSTRAEGDLEEYEIEEANGEKKSCQRVIPESYRYVTTDFTADPSTFNVEPVALQRNVVPVIQREMKDKNAGRFATLLYESIQKKTNETHTSVLVQSDSGVQVSAEVEGEATVTTTPAGSVDIVPAHSAPTPQESATGADVEPEEEYDMEGELNSGEPKIEEPEEEMSESKLTEDTWKKMSSTELDECSITEDKAFRKCVSGGGRVRRVSGEKEHGLDSNEYVNYCFLDGKSYRGEVKTKETESKVNESPLSVKDVQKLFVSIHPAFAKYLTGLYGDKRKIAQVGMKAGLELSDEGRDVFYGFPPFDVDSKKDTAGADQDESKIYKDLIDLKVTEASIRAERDALLESAEKDGDAGLQIRILADELFDVQRQSTKEISGLRRVLEAKAQEVGILKQKLEEAVRTRKSEAELNAMFKVHQDELVQAVNDAKLQARRELLREYFDHRLVGCNLRVDENSRALLEGCQNLGDVDSLVDKLIGVARRSALHTKPLNEVKVQRVETIDSEQKKINDSVGSLMKRLL